MNTPLLLINQAERLLLTIRRLEPPYGSRLSKLQARAYVRYVRRFVTAYHPDGFAPSSSQPSGVVG